MAGEGTKATSAGLDLLQSMTGRVGEQMVEGVKVSQGMADPHYRGKRVVDTNGDGKVNDEDLMYLRARRPTERTVIVPLLEWLNPGSVKREGDDIYISPGVYMALNTLLPQLSVELAAHLDPILSEDQADNKASYLLRQWTGVLKETHYRADKTE